MPSAMSNPEPTRPAFQYTLWSLLVVCTVVAVVCSMVASGGLVVPILVILGAGVCSIGFGPLSHRKHPKQGCASAFAGFLVRLLGLVIIAFAVLLWFSQAGRGR